MFTKQALKSLAALLLTALFCSPCAAQVIYVRDARGELRPVVIPQTTTFSLGMQGSAVVSPDHMFVRVNVTPFGLSMPDPSTTTFRIIPQPNIATFSNGVRQPPTIALKPIVIPIQGQAGMFSGGPGGFGATTFGGFSSATQFSAIRPNSLFGLRPMGGTFTMTNYSQLDYGGTWTPLFQRDLFANNPWVMPPDAGP